jgi:hypothetical protein
MSGKTEHEKREKTGEGCLLGFLLVLGGLVGPGTHALAGPTSPLYITGDWSAQRTDDVGLRSIYVVQGANVINMWTKFGLGESAIAVTDTVRTNGMDGGKEYTLSGVPTGVRFASWSWAPFSSGIFDGTTDGTYNYVARSYAVYRTDRDWANAVQLFGTVGWGGYMGITYDSSNNSFWLADSWDDMIVNRSMTGEVLSSFPAPDPTFLALDHADGTLWTAPYDGNLLQQYSRTGTLLSTQVFLDSAGKEIWFGDYPGGEFPLSADKPVSPNGAPIPDPSSLVLAGCGLAALAFRRRRGAKVQN